MATSKNKHVPGTGAGQADQDKTFDSVLLAIMANRMDAICREMTNTVLFSARSAVIGIARDFSCAIITSADEVLAVAEAMPIHVFGMHLQTASMAKYHPDFREGDAFLDNDPYIGNSHAADHTFLIPVFFEGEHFFTAAVKAHQADCGNSIPTTYHGSARDVYAEGALIFPAVRVQENYQDIQDIVRMCRMRIRVPEQWWGDYLAAMGAARIGERELMALGEEVGWDTLDAFTSQWLEYSEQRMTAVISRLPAGKMTVSSAHDAFPGAEEGIQVKVQLAIDPVDAIIEVDLRDNPDCLPCGLNLSEACSRTSASETPARRCAAEKWPMLFSVAPMVRVVVSQRVWQKYQLPLAMWMMKT